MGRYFRERPSKLLGLRDETVAMAIDVAATYVLSLNDRELAKIAQLEAAQLMWGGASQEKPEKAWVTVEEW